MPKSYRLAQRRGSRKKIAGAAMTGDELRQLRIGANVSLTELAREAGYNATYIGMLELGRSRIVLRTAQLLRLAIERLSRTSRGTTAT